MLRPEDLGSDEAPKLKVPEPVRAAERGVAARSARIEPSPAHDWMAAFQLLSLKLSASREADLGSLSAPA